MCCRAFLGVGWAEMFGVHASWRRQMLIAFIAALVLWLLCAIPFAVPGALAMDDHHRWRSWDFALYLMASVTLLVAILTLCTTVAITFLGVKLKRQREERAKNHEDQQVSLENTRFIVSIACQAPFARAYQLIGNELYPPFP